MGKYALFDDNGLPQAFYDDRIHSSIPEEAIEITEEQWLEFINNPGQRKWDFSSNQVIPFNPEDLLSFDEKKARLKRSIHQIRKEKENAGINVSTTQGTFILDTSQVGRSNIQGTILTYEVGILDKTSDSVPWKFENGFLDLTYDQLKEIASFVTDYIEKLFLAEKQHYDAIEGLSTEEELQNYDTNQYWPNNTYNASF